MSLRRAALILLIAATALLPSCGKKLPPRWVEPVPATPPYELSALYRSDSVRIAWRHAGGARFMVQRSLDGASFTDIEVTREMAFIDLAGGPKYHYRVAAINPGASMSEAAFTDSIAPPGEIALVKPDALRAEVRGDQVALSWSYAGSAKFNVYEGDATSFVRIAGPMAKEVRSLSLPADPSRSVRYTVRAVTGDGISAEGPASDTVEVGLAQYVPAKVGNVQAATSGEGVVLVIWDASPESWVTSYNIYRAVGSGRHELVGSSRTPAFTDTPPAAAKLSYKVRAKGPLSEGPDSDAADVKSSPSVVK